MRPGGDGGRATTSFRAAPFSIPLQGQGCSLDHILARTVIAQEGDKLPRHSVEGSPVMRSGVRLSHCMALVLGLARRAPCPS